MLDDTKIELIRNLTLAIDPECEISDKEFDQLRAQSEATLCTAIPTTGCRKSALRRARDAAAAQLVRDAMERPF